MEIKEPSYSHFHFYRPQKKFAKVMFSQVSVCPGGGCLPHYMLGYTPPGQTPLPLGRHTPPGRHPLGQALPLGRHPLGRHPPAQCMLGYTHPCPVHAGIHTPLPSACWDTHNPLPSACCYTPSCTVHAGIRSISGRYAFHWNAFL